MRPFLTFAESDTSVHRRPTLNPLLWEGDRLRPDVRTSLLNFSEAWRAFCRIPHEMVRDSWMLGGNAGYFYGDASDIDVHLVVDVAGLGFGPVVDEYLRDRKVVWLTKHDVRVRGYPVEPFVQDIREAPVRGQGVYSLESDRWVQRPTDSSYDPSQDPNLQAKVETWRRAVDQALDEDDPDLDVLKRKLSGMRGEGISREGELAPENLIFKELRLSGHLDRLRSRIGDRESRELSLD